MKITPSAIAYCLLAILIAGCGESEKITQLEARIKALEAKPATKSGLFDDLIPTNKPQFDPSKPHEVLKLNPWEVAERKQTAELLADLNDRVSNLELPKNFREIRLDFTQKSYSPAKTILGNLLVVADSAEPYLEGYKIKLTIGNPFAVGISSFDINTTTSIDSTNATEFLESARNKTFPITENLRAGYWNPVEFVLSPCKPSELRNLEITIDTHLLSLAKPTK